MPQDRKREKVSAPSKVGRTDRYPSDYGVRDREEQEKASKEGRDRSWVPGDKGQGREGLRKGYGGSGGHGTGSSGPGRK